MKMNNTASKVSPSPLLKAFKNLFTKLVKSSDEYPVKYYKRDRNFSRVRQS